MANEHGASTGEMGRCGPDLMLLACPPMHLFNGRGEHTAIAPQLINSTRIKNWSIGMLIRFSSIKTESITMFGNVALQLIGMLGASGNIPGAIGAEDIPAAVKRLRQQLQMHAAANVGVSEKASDQDDDDEDDEPPIALATRAGPLIDILERAGAAKVPVMWERTESAL